MSNIAKLYTESNFNDAITKAVFTMESTGHPQAIADADKLIVADNLQVKLSEADEDEKIGISMGIRIGLALAEIFAEEENQRVDSCADEVFSAEDGKKLRNKLPSLSRYD